MKNAPSSFAIRCRGQRIDLLVSTVGSWRPSNKGEFKVAYQIDNQPTVEQQWAALAGGRGAVFKGDVSRFLQALWEAKQLSIRVYDWQGLAHDATFQIPGLDVVREKMVSGLQMAMKVQAKLYRAPSGIVLQNSLLRCESATIESV